VTDAEPPVVRFPPAAEVVPPLARLPPTDAAAPPVLVLAPPVALVPPVPGALPPAEDAAPPAAEAPPEPPSPVLATTCKKQAAQLNAPVRRLGEFCSTKVTCEVAVFTVSTTAT
jgi:hypothetical protein